MLSSLKKLLPVVILGGGYIACGSIGHAEDVDLKKVMDEIRAIKAKNSELEAKNADLQKQVTSIKSGDGGKRASAEVAVDKALKRSADDGFYHDADLHPRKIKIGGLVDFSYQYNLNNPGERYNSLRAFDNGQSNDFALNMANVYFDGTAKQKGEAGFMIDLGFGRDANTGYGLGYDNVLQAYINYIAPIGKGVEMTVGKFYTPIGFEVAKGDNWNITRSMNFAWTQPLSHTGGQLGYQVLDSWNIKAGVVNSFYNRTAQDNNNDKTFYISNTWKPLKNLSWSVTGMVGNEDTRQSSVAGLYNGSTGGTSNIYGSNTAQYDNVINSIVPLIPGLPTAGQGLFATPNAGPNYGNGFSPASYGAYGDYTPPNYVNNYGGSNGLRGSDSSMLYTVNSVITYDPMETLHFGFEFNWQMKTGYNYKHDDLLSEPGGEFFNTNLGLYQAATGSYASTLLAQTGNNGGLGVSGPSLGTDLLTTAQSQALWNYYHRDAGNATTWGAAGYVKWDFQKNWYVALRGEYISDQDNLAFRNDGGVAAQTAYLNAAKAALLQNVNYGGTTGGTFAPGPGGSYNPILGLPAGGPGSFFPAAGGVTTYGPLALNPGTYGPITPEQYNAMIKKLDHRNNDAWSVTGTVGWNITKALKWKLEYRHDQAAKDVFYRGGSHQVNALPPAGTALPLTVFGAITPTTAPGGAISNGYVPNTSNSQDTVSMQFQYSF